MKNKQMKCIKGKSCLYCGSAYCRFVDELDQLKAENKELKKSIKICWENLKISEENKKIQHEHWFQRCSEIQAKANDFEQTLIEIKEIANLSIAHLNIDYLKQAINDILQKISECEVEDGSE